MAQHEAETSGYLADVGQYRPMMVRQLRAQRRYLSGELDEPTISSLA